MKRVKLIVLLAALGLTFASCTKEDGADNTCVVAAASSVTYFINGHQYYANPKTDAEWSAFLDRMLALAGEGYAVRIVRTGVGQQANATKEKVVYTTTSYRDAKAWAAEMMLQGYEVTIIFNQQTGEYTCIATR